MSNANANVAIKQLANMIDVEVAGVEATPDMIRVEIHSEQDGELMARALKKSGVKAFYSFGFRTKKHTVCIPV